MACPQCIKIMHRFINYSAGCKNRIVTKACQLLTTQIYTINQLVCPASVLMKLSLPIENKAEMKDINWGVKIAIFDKLIDLFHVWVNVNRQPRQFFHQYCLWYPQIYFIYTNEALMKSSTISQICIEKCKLWYNLFCNVAKHRIIQHKRYQMYIRSSHFTK